MVPASDADYAPGEPGAEELAACIRDLTSLYALPALWSGRDAATIGKTLFESLEAVLPADVCYLLEPESFDMLRAGQRMIAREDEAPWREFMAACRAQSRGVETIDSPLGPMRVARTRMTVGAAATALWVGSRQPGFPSMTQRAYLVAASSLASSGLRTARLAEERERADRAKDEFLAMLAHELRNPLAPITTALDLMQLKRKAEVDYERDVIARQVRHLTRLVDDLMDVARVARGKIELKRAPLALDRIVAEAIETAHPLIEQRRHALDIAVPAGLRVEGDAERLKQVVANLVTNAAKYTDTGGLISVSAARAGERVRLAVRDNGTGIERELLPRVFDLFAQGKTGPDRSMGGLGIGLALVKTLVQLHGGEVRAESGGPGQGSTFILELPALPEAGGVRAAPAPPVAEPRPAQRSILVVDDNHDAAASLALLLQMLGHEVRLAHDARQALAALEGFPADVVVLDIGLPGMDGYELARELRVRLGARTPRLIAVTGYGQPQDRARSVAAGIDYHITKPVGVDTLAGLLH